MRRRGRRGQQRRGAAATPGRTGQRRGAGGWAADRAAARWDFGTVRWDGSVISIGRERGREGERERERELLLLV